MKALEEEVLSVIIECLFSINDFKLSIKLYRVTLNILLVKEEGALFVLVRVRVCYCGFEQAAISFAWYPFYREISNIQASKF